VSGGEVLLVLLVLGSLGARGSTPTPRKGRMTLAQLRSLAAHVGFPDPVTAAAVAMAESGGDPTATNIVSQAQATAWNLAHPGARPHGPERSFGLWQVNTIAWPSYDETQLLDPTYNAQAALAISHGGTDWSHWSTYTDGTYRAYLMGA
jgi:hypothetical protein